MTKKEKITMLQSLKDIQQQIESFEDAWSKATNVRSRRDIDRRIDSLLAMRHGMEMMMTDLGIKFDRKECRNVNLNGEMQPHTIWYLV